MEEMEAMEAELNKPVNTPITNRPMGSANPQEKKTGRASDEYRDAMLHAIRNNFRNIRNVLSEGIDTDGGYLVPEEYDSRLIEGLEEENIFRRLTVVPFGQGFKDMSPPTKELMKLTLEKKLAHGGHPVLHWMMDNIFIRTDPAGNIKADKEKSTEKIDGAIATIMGLDRAIRCGNDVTASVYDERGILFI